MCGNRCEVMEDLTFRDRNTVLAVMAKVRM